jgi:hypothetical protein
MVSPSVGIFLPDKKGAKSNRTVEAPVGCNGVLSKETPQQRFAVTAQHRHIVVTRTVLCSSDNISTDMNWLLRRKQCPCGFPTIIIVSTMVVLCTSIRHINVAASVNNGLYKTKNRGMRTRQAAVQLGVQPSWNVPGWVRRIVFKLEKRIIPILFSTFSTEPIIPNSYLSLCVLWWKAVASSRPFSPMHDPECCWADLMLPPNIRSLTRIYPRLTSVVTIEVRSTFIDQAIKQCIEQVRKIQSDIQIRLVIVGAGYDTRSIRLLHQHLVDEAYELDLPNVIQAKTNYLQSQRLSERSIKLPQFIAVDLNQQDQVESELRGILIQNDPTQQWHTIFVMEAVLMYLDQGKTIELLSTLRRSLPDDYKNEDNSCRRCGGSLVFADRLEMISNDDNTNQTVAAQELHQQGWWLREWLLKDGGTKHMGWATSTAWTET